MRPSRACRNSGSAGAQPSASQLGQRLRVALACQDGLKHLAPALAQHIGGHGAERKVGSFQYLVQAVDRLRALGHQRRAVARQFAQLAHRLRRDET
jgi:hypothetical protein